MSAAKYVLFPLALGILLAANAYFVSHFLYLKVWWLDIMLHAIGGIFIAMFFRVFISRQSLAGLCTFSLIVGLTWEALEFLFPGQFFGAVNASFSNSLWILDTIKDLVIDILSGMLWWALAWAYNRDNA
jgi:hypothetical protein